ncbi:MAG: class I SAM-dependent methyltransferase [Bdellovibrionota bacterium]
MKTEWDYTDLADAYLKRAPYSDQALDEMVRLASLDADSVICDVGAGTAHLTLPIAKRGYRVTSVEPNDAMRANGMRLTSNLPNVSWIEGTGEDTKQPVSSFDMVTFGSSFNVTDRPRALVETARILKNRGWFACMWNHRSLEDPIQQGIESVIRKHIPEYDYGSRREDQTEVINASGLFGKVHKLEGPVSHRQSIDDCVEAWRSHATLHRQAGNSFQTIVDEIENFLRAKNVDSIDVPYQTRIWCAQKKS